MNQVTQQVAANAEESASASEEMSSQSEQMKNVVRELVGMVGGRHNGRAARGTGSGFQATRLSLPRAASRSQQEKKLLPAPSGDSQEYVIPLKEKDFQDF